MMYNPLINKEVSNGSEFLQWVVRECRAEIEAISQKHIDGISEILYRVSPRKSVFQNSKFNADRADNIDLDELVSRMEEINRAFKPTMMNEQELLQWQRGHIAFMRIIENLPTKKRAELHQILLEKGLVLDIGSAYTKPPTQEPKKEEPKKEEPKKEEPKPQGEGHNNAGKK